MLLPEAMAFAINEVNRRKDLLPNVTLGFEIWDHGWSEEIAVGIALSLLQNSPSDQSNWPDRKKLVGIVGPETSAISVIVSKITQIYQIPLVSHWATSNELSNKARFPFFLRTVPPDQLQAGVIVDLLLHFGWDYIAVVYTVDSYGIHGTHELVSQAENNGICIAMSAPLSELDTDHDLLDIVLKLKRLSSVRIVVIFATGNLPGIFLRQVSKIDFPYKITWIGSDGWGYELPYYDIEEVVRGGIFVRLNSPKQPAFEMYLNTIDPRVKTTGQWFTQHWKEKLAQNCTEAETIKKLCCSSDRWFLHRIQYSRSN